MRIRGKWETNESKEYHNLDVYCNNFIVKMLIYQQNAALTAQLFNFQ